MMKWFFIIPIAFATLIVAISFYLQPNSFIGCGEKPSGAGTNCDSADAIVVVSGGNTEARTAAGIRLYLNGWSQYLVMSGAALDKSGPSNAAAMKYQAEQAGVPSSAILIDEDAANGQTSSLTR